MKFKESNKQKFIMRNVYINQIMKPQIQNNLNYAYFENPRDIVDYCNNQGLGLNNKSIFFSNKPIKTFYQNYIPKPNKSKKDSSSYRKSVVEIDDNFYGKNTEEFNKSNTLGRNHKKIKIHFNERSFSENKLNNFNQTYNMLKEKETKNENISYLRVNQVNKNGKITKNESRESNNNMNLYGINKDSIIKASTNETTFSKNNNSNSSLKSVLNSKKYFYNERNKKQNIKVGKNVYNSDYNKNSINQLKNIININNACTTSPNSNNNSYNNKINNNNLKYSNKNFSGKTNVKSYKYFDQIKNHCCVSLDKNPIRNDINYKNNINNFNSPNRQIDDFKNIDNISIFNSPSVPSYSSIIEDNSINSKNFVWVKKNIKNNIIDSNYLYNYYKKPNINKEKTINQNLINFANDITNMNSSLYNTEILYPDSLSKGTKTSKTYEEKDMEHSAILIQSVFRGFIIKKKFDMFYRNYKYYYRKGIEILELILNYFFQKSINIIEEKRRFFKYLLSIKKIRQFSNKNSMNKNKISQKPKSYKNFKIINSHFSPSNYSKKPNIKNYYQDLFLHKEIIERFNIIRENNREKDIEKRYKDKLELINLKLNKLIKENNILKDINQKNIIKDSKYREMSRDNKKKDDIINIITNDNKTLARKLKIIQDKYNKLQIQNQDNINYNLDNEFSSKNHGIDIFEEYRNLFLEFILHKLNEKYHLSILRKYFYKLKNLCFAVESNNKTKETIKVNKLKCLLNNKKNKENIRIYHNLTKFYYKSKLSQKEIENKNNKIKYKLLNIFKNKQNSYKSYLKKYFYQFYYKGIISSLNQEKRNKTININKDNYKKIKKFLNVLLKRKDKYLKNLKREYFIKWHLYTKVIALKALINDKRRKKRQKQKLKKKNENEVANKYLNNNKILHFGKSNIYILNKDKEKDLLISLDDKNQKCISNNSNLNIDNKYNNVIQATKKLGDLFYKAAQNHNLLNKNYENNAKCENEIMENNNKDNINNVDNNAEEDEDSGDSLGI